MTTYERIAVSQETLNYVASRFTILGDFIQGAPYGSGHINDTFAVSMEQGGSRLRYIFQRINHGIFKDPALLMENIWRVTNHCLEGCQRAGESDCSRKTLTVIPARDGKPYVVDTAGYFWRAYIFIENAQTYDRIENTEQAYEAARAFGQFQTKMADMPGGRLHETIPHFHDTRQRFGTLIEAVERDACERAAEVQDEIHFFKARKADASRLLEMNEAGVLPERVSHNDCKLNNVMIDDATGQGICVIDLDTVMPGLALYDFGDLVRTATSPALEDELDTSKVAMQLPMFEALVRGFVAGAGNVLSSAELDQLAFSGKLITLETGIRFLTDYLDGDHYFKIHRDRHNLDRCRTQIALVQSIESQIDEMAAIVKDCTEELEGACVS